jgi:hypothetical protein
MRLVRLRIERSGERLWCFDDFRHLPFSAVAQALSRLSRSGVIERLCRGIYYRSRKTAQGRSRPSKAAMRELVSRQRKLFPSGVAAAKLLGFTTQVPNQDEIATSALSVPRKLLGESVLIHTRRPEAWAGLSETDAALLDFLRLRGEFSKLSPEATIQKLLVLLSESGRLERMVKVAGSEPPRVRAMLGALVERLGVDGSVVRHLRKSLNPLSRFDFGRLTALPNARDWQAKETS